MQVTSSSEFRKHLKKFLHVAGTDLEPVVVHRGKEAPVVVISLEEFNALEATAHEMSSKKNHLRLKESIAHVATGRTKGHPLLEVE